MHPSSMLEKHPIQRRFSPIRLSKNLEQRMIMNLIYQLSLLRLEILLTYYLVFDLPGEIPILQFVHVFV